MRWPIKLLPLALLILSTGCWSFPSSPGTWSGTVVPLRLYDGDRECDVAMLDFASGTRITPPIGSRAFLVDSNGFLVDASSFPAGAKVKITGTAGYKFAVDAKGGTPSAKKNVDARGVAYPGIEIRSVSLSNGQRVDLIAAIAHPSTRMSQGLSTMPTVNSNSR